MHVVGSCRPTRLNIWRMRITAENEFATNGAATAEAAWGWRISPDRRVRTKVLVERVSRCRLAANESACCTKLTFLADPRLLEPARIFSAGNSGLSNSGKSFSRCAPRDISGTRKTWPRARRELSASGGVLMLLYGVRGVDRGSESSLTLKNQSNNL